VTQAFKPLKLLIDDTVENAQQAFGELGAIQLKPGRDIGHADLTDKDILIVRSRTQVNQALLGGTPVKFVGSCVAGRDHLDEAYLAAQGITLATGDGCNAQSVAEYVITCLLLLAQKHALRLEGKTLGIIGVGNVGSRLAKLAQVLGLNCLLNDPPRARLEGSDGFVDLDTALRADFISIHTPLIRDGQDTTLNLLNAEKIAQLQPHQMLINAARGDVLDEAALIAQPLKDCIIDCWQNEPQIHPQLLAKAWIATPHIAGHALEAKLRGTHLIQQALFHWLQRTPSQTLLKEPTQAPADWLTQIPPNARLATLLAIYDPRTDDAYLRSHLSQFEDYRRHYPLRHEWLFNPD
jgi:erythronate-4-phosphate dehydrogenase